MSSQSQNFLTYILLNAEIQMVPCENSTKEVSYQRALYKPRTYDENEIFSTLSSARLNQSHVGENMWQPSSFYYEFQREYRSGENKLSNVRNLIIQRSGEGLTSFNGNISVQTFVVLSVVSLIFVLVLESEALY